VRAIYEEQGYVVNGLDGFGRLMSEIDRASGVVADFGNILFADDKVEDFIPEYEGKIANVHIKDYIALPKDSADAREVELRSESGTILRDCPFGEGVVNFKAAFAELKKIGYDGYYATECPPMGEDEEATFKKNIKILSEYIEAIQR
ncbi:MAG: sugar phosphate isomerase/epimerase, partial [Clostridia bacterium]|nr:sugar phosphate isomerase/epimerase [Clostridia bacterium]